ncbi:hypothetical protein ACLB1G_17305 [Oxalobacteraceae bacterium A2-2]
MTIPCAAGASLLAILLATATGGARADIHRHIDAASGMEVLSNVAAMPAAAAGASAAGGAGRSGRATGASAGAAANAGNTGYSPRATAGQGQAMPASAGPGQAGAVHTLGGQAGTRALAAAASFPVISRAQQSELDGGRRAILEDELRAERQALQAARARQAAADILHRHDMNIAALTRELAALR